MACAGSRDHAIRCLACTSLPLVYCHPGTPRSALNPINPQEAKRSPSRLLTSENSRITGQYSFQSTSRKPDLAWVTGALHYFSAGFLMHSGPLGRARLFSAEDSHRAQDWCGSEGDHRSEFGHYEPTVKLGRDWPANRPYRESTVVRANRQPKRSFTGFSRFCLQPRYRSVVSTDT